MARFSEHGVAIGGDSPVMKPREQSQLDHVRDRIGEAAERLELMTADIDRLTDRLFGAVPCAEECATALQGVRSGLYGDILSALDRLERGLADHGDAIKRIAGL